MKKIKILSVVLSAGILSIVLLNHFLWNIKVDDHSTEVTRVKSSIDLANYIFRMIRTKTGNEPVNQIVNSKILAELDKQKKSLNNIRSAEENWIERGPGNVGGRMRAIIVDKSDPENRTWLAGSASGGIWRTTNAGLNWVNVSPDLPNLAVVTLAQSASDPSVIYAGTGEGALGGSFANGYGIFKSLDNGLTWDLLDATSLNNSEDFFNTNRIIVNPDDSNDIIAATSNGVGNDFRSAVMRSLDGGTAWEAIWSPEARAQQILAHPESFDTLFVSVLLKGVAKSVDGGQTFYYTDLGDVVSSTGNTVERTEIAISPQNPDIVYASVSYRNRTGSGLYRSSDGGETWMLVSDASTTEAIDYLSQGEYDNCIMVNPFNSDEVFFGGVLLYRASIVDGDIKMGENSYLGTNENGTKDFLSFISFNNGNYFNNQLAISDPANTPTIEIRFGPGKKQMAHRFVVPVGATAGVPDENYSYQDYVEVPFEVWNVDDNIQLMVSFRDQERDGSFNLNVRDEDDQDLATNREYLYVHNVNYSTQPSAELAVNGGQEIKQYLFFWPTLTPGAVWDSNLLPESSLKINFGTVWFQNASVVRMPGEVHPDHHYLTPVVKEGNNTFGILSANDGGIAYTLDKGTTFAELESGLNTTQFYSAAKKQGEKIYIGGTQDNDILMASAADGDAATLYNEQDPSTLADGFDVIWRSNDTEQILISYQKNVIMKSMDGGQTYKKATNGLDDSGFNNVGAPFVSRLATSSARPQVVFAVSETGVWRSVNFGDSWEQATVNVSTGNKWGGFLDIEVSDVDPNIVWAGGAIDEDRSIFLSIDGGKNFDPVAKYDSALGNITAIVPDPNDANIAYLLLSQFDSPKILKTVNLGETWEDISGFSSPGDGSSNGYPDLATFSLLVFPDGLKLWAGTEIGLIESLDGGESWHMTNNGIPNVLIFDMKVVDGEVIAATYGRGIWTVDLDLVYPNQQQPTAVSKPLSYKDFIVLKNPTHGSIKFRASEKFVSQNKNVYVYNLNGVVVSSLENVNVGENELAINQPNGVYLIKYHMDNKVHSSRVVLIR